MEEKNKLLIVGRWHGIVSDQDKELRRSITDCGPGKLVFIITAADQKGTKRHPLSVGERREILDAFARTLQREYEIHAINDIHDSAEWITHMAETVAQDSNGQTTLDAAHTIVVSANPDVLNLFKAAGYRYHSPSFDGKMPSDLLDAIRKGGDWRNMATAETLKVYDAYGIAARVREIFADMLVTEDGELSVGRDFAIYGAAMDASLQQKVDDLLPWVKPGLIVDKGCGTGKLMIELSKRFPTSQIIGVDLSSELLKVADSQHYPNHNVSVVRGNVIPRRFADRSVATQIYSSIFHEIYTYNEYSREMVRQTLRHTYAEAEEGGRILGRDGVSPGQATVCMRCDDESTKRFLMFANDFKKMSGKPGITYAKQHWGGLDWYVLSLHDANEFLSKKDYIKNWDIEVNEEFGVFQKDEWCRELEAVGFRMIDIHAYVNEWIRINRYVDRVALHAYLGETQGPGELLVYPATTLRWAAERP
jgi:tRNA G46 methylase TrmB